MAASSEFKVGLESFEGGEMTELDCLQLESAQGGTDEEAEGALAELKEKMATLAAAESATESDRLGSREGAAPPDDMQLASALDRFGSLS